MVSESTNVSKDMELKIYILEVCFRVFRFIAQQRWRYRRFWESIWKRVQKRIFPEKTAENRDYGQFCTKSYFGRFLGHHKTSATHHWDKDMQKNLHAIEQGT